MNNDDYVILEKSDYEKLVKLANTNSQTSQNNVVWFPDIIYPDILHIFVDIFIDTGHTKQIAFTITKDTLKQMLDTMEKHKYTYL